MAINLTVHARAAEGIGCGAVQIDDDALGGFGPRPQHKHALDTLPHAALKLPDNLCPAIE